MEGEADTGDTVHSSARFFPVISSQSFPAVVSNEVPLKAGRRKGILDDGNSICEGSEAEESKTSCGARVAQHN